MTINPDRLAARLDAAIERGELTDQEARDEWAGAEEEAIYEAQEDWS